MGEGFLLDQPEYRDFRDRMAETVAAELVARLSADRGVRGVLDAVTRALAVIDRTIAEVLAMPPGSPPLACRAKCSLCCQARIESRPLQSVYAALYARATLADDAFARVQHRTLTRREPCPMLEDDACVIYPGRPLVCRSYFSFDFERCQQGRYGVASADDRARRRHGLLRYDIQAAFSRAIDRATVELGLTAESQHLDTALRIVFTEPGVIERWLAGGDVFPEARRAVPGKS